MSIYDEWKKSKENNIYERWKREKEKEIQQEQQRINKISTYDNIKKSTLKDIGTTIREESEKNKQQITNNSQNNNSSSQKLLLPLLNQGETININNNTTDNLSNMSSGQRVATIHSITSNQNDANKLNQETIQYQQQEEAQEKANKINDDIKKGNYSSALAHVLLGIPQKALDSTSTTLASMNSLVAPKKINSSIADENELLKTNRTLTSTYENTTNKIDNDIVKTASNVSGTIGGMLPSIVSNIAMPGSGAIVQGVNVGASAYQDTLNEDASNKSQAAITGTAKGIVSGLVEKISGGNIIGKGSLDDTVTNFISNKFKGKTGQKLASKAYEMIGEIGEENLEDNVGYIIDKLVNNKELPSFQEWWSNTKETTKGTFLTTLVLNALGLGGNTYNEVQDVNAKKYLNEAKNIIRTELNNSNALQIDSKTNALNELNNVKSIKNYSDYIENNKSALNIANQEYNLKQNQANNVNNLQTQQTIQEQNKMSQNQTSSQLNDILNNKELPMQSYQYELSDNVKINNLRQDANRYFNNSERARNYVSMLEKIITDKNIEIRLDGNLKTADGRIANGSYSNGVMTINPNSTRAGEFIAIHELTHAIGTKEMLNMVNTYRNSNTEFDTAIKGLLKNYKGTEITEEALSDVAGQLFGNQEFINNIAQNNPNIFQKLYSEIKYLWHQFRGYKNQNQFVEDLYYKWTQAYNSNNGLNGTRNYSIAGINAVNNIQNNSDLYNQAINKYNQANTMENQGIDNEIIRQNTGWFQDKNGDWKFEFSDKHMSLKDIKYEIGKEYKLGNILNHNELFMFYPKLAEYNVEFVEEKNSKKKAKYDDKTKTIFINSKLLNKQNAQQLIEGTLIHEIQHAIQHMEGFETGKSSFSKLAYYNSLGEIEADNTKTRFIDEKYNKKNISNIAPESSKSNPKHRGIDNYLQNRNTLEKIKDKIYNSIENYLNEKSDLYEEDIQENIEENLYDNKQTNNVGRHINEQRNSNESSFSMQDNQGRILTKEQQEFFKDSKVRDENGNLKTMYHGSNNRFSVFKHGEAYRGSSKASVGYWFTETAKGAENFANSVWYGDTETGAKVYEVYLNIKKPKIYEGIDNTKELNKIDNEINILKETIRKLENKNIAIEINKQELRWANSKEELMDIAKYKGIDLEDAENYHNAINQYNDLIEEYDNKKYNDSYELFRADIYKIAGKSASEANIGGTGMYLNNEEEVVKQYVEELEKQGYDGIIIKNTKFDNETLGKDNSQYVVFNSNQIKNVDNTNPTSNPDIRYSQNNQTWQQYLDKNFKPTGTRTSMQDILPTPQDIYKMDNKEKVDILTDKDYEVLNKIYEKEGKTEILTEKKKANLLEKYANDKYAIKDSLDILAQKFINKGHYIDQLAEKTKNKELKFIYDKNLNSFAEGQYVVGVAQTDNQGNEIGKSINEIWEPLENSNLTKQFSEYLLHKHNIDRSERGKYIFGEEIGAAESTSIALELEKKYPEFKKYAEDIKKFNHNNLMNLKEAGMLTQDTIDYIEAMYPNYIAISRNLEEKLYTGSNEKTGAASPLKKAVGGNSDIQPIKDTMAQQAIKIKRLVNQNELGKELSKTLKDAQVDEGVDIELSPTLLLDIDTMVDADNQGNKYYLYFEDGKQIKLKINDNLYESLKPTEISKTEKTFPVKALQKVTSIHRSLLTSSNPIFVVTNFFKDFQDGAFNSKYSSKFIKNYGKALNEIYTKGKYYQSYMANGGMTNTYFDYNEGIKKQNKFVQKIRDINEIVEQLPRIAEFISTLEDGKSLNEALYNAAEITTNFKRGGDITKLLNRNGVNFLNASIQGLDKQFRNFSGQNGAKGYVNLLAKATIMSIIPSALNHMLLDDDEDYQNLPQSTKDLYYLFKYDDGKFIRIPKGRVLSIFGAAARRTLETIQGQDDAWEGYGKFIIDQIGPNNLLTDNIVAPVMQTAINKTWYGGDLVSSRLQEELPENQYDETTDEFSKWLGKQIKVSPKKINYLIDQYSGGIGDVILPIITPQAKQNVLIDKFTTDSVLKNKNVSKFYETLEKQTQIANDSFATDEDQLQLKYLNSISRDMSDLYKQKREIQMSNISNTEKTRQVREIQSKINELAEKGLSNYSNVNKTNNSSKIGDEEYYRDSKGNWTTIDEEEKAKIGDLSLDTYSEYKQKVYEKTQEKKSSGELTQNQILKDKDKIQILLDSKYSDKEITSIYESQIKSTKDTQYDVISKSGIDIKEYLKYKQQEFESDKKDDGTTTGKTVSGSKKKKVYNYVNSMNITYNQKLLLLGMQYNLTNTEKTKLANYVNSMKLTKQEKLDIYEKLSGFTVYKNGRVTW